MKIVRLYILIGWIGLLGIDAYGQAQSAFLPQNMGTAVNSQYHDINPVLSPDGQTLYFVRVNHPENTYGAYDSEDIWYSTLQPDGTWTNAKRITELNVGRYNSVLAVSSDGKALLLNGIYNKNGTIFKKRGLSISRRFGDFWGTPDLIWMKRYSAINRGMKSGISVSNDGTRMMLSFSKQYNSERSDIFVAELRSDSVSWGRPKKVKALSSRYSDDTPFISPDQKFIYLSSDRAQKGKFDIYKSERTTDGWEDWLEPKLMSDTINTNEWEGYFKTNRNGSGGYFSSMNNTLGKADLFKVKLFEENPFVMVTGLVVNAKTKEPLLDKPFKIAINGVVVDSLKTLKSTAQYLAKLPLGKLYTISARVENYTYTVDTVDVRNIKEFTELNRDLYVTPIPFVKVNGNLLVKGTGMKIPASAKPEIFVDNEKVDSLQLDATASTYTVKLPHGRMYNLQVRANRFDPIPYTLDLTDVHEYQEIRADLFADEEKMAIISGNVIDKKTGKPLVAKGKVTLKVEGIKSVVADVDSATSHFELKLLPGHTYTVSASVPNYYPIYEEIDLTAERDNVHIYKDLVIVPIEVGQSIRLNNIFFESGKAVLKKESFVELDRVVEFLDASPDIKIEIGGHTDNVGKAATNLKLSTARANSVTKYIVSKGISASRISPKGYGMTKPVTENKTPQGRSQNRRVEFTILDK
jgi:outer membrane protein OmpA-like peptidoglycan-associated protein